MADLVFYLQLFWLFTIKVKIDKAKLYYYAL